LVVLKVEPEEMESEVAIAKPAAIYLKIDAVRHAEAALWHSIW